MVHIDYKDHEGLRIQSENSAKMGFTGKQVIHPSQIAIVHDSYRYYITLPKQSLFEVNPDPTDLSLNILLCLIGLPTKK